VLPESITQPRWTRFRLESEFGRSISQVQEKWGQSTSGVVYGDGKSATRY
jgi:hypothetical protein